MLFLMSERGLPLVLSNGLPLEPTLTVELYEKWYDLHLVHPDGKVEKVPYPDDLDCCPTNMSPYRDHVPNPEVVVKFARLHGYQIDNLAIELMVGRWEIETEDRYFSPPEG